MGEPISNRTRTDPSAASLDHHHDVPAYAMREASKQPFQLSNFAFCAGCHSI
jgi:hypothetical protein